MRRKTRGFSLIELLAVVFILSLGLTSVSMLFVAGQVSSRKAQRISAATNRAQKELERLRSAGFSGCVADPEIFTAADGYTILLQNPDMTGQIGFAVPDLPNGQGVIDVAFYTGATGVYPNLKDITITITWAGGGPTAGSAVLETLVANRP